MAPATRYWPSRLTRRTPDVAVTSRFRFLTVTALLAAFAVAASMRAQSPDRDAGAFLARYCAGCHDARQRAGGLVLPALDVSQIDRDRATWEHVARRLRDGSMPPPGLPRPDVASSLRFARTLEDALDRAAEVVPQPGRPVLHRLNRIEYANAVRDLLALEVEPDHLLPADPVFDGFDNMGGVLSMTPALMDRYLSAARRLTRLAVGDPAIDAAFASATYVAPQDVWQRGRMSEALPFGSRGGMAVRHRFPLDGQYVARIRLARNVLGYVRGLAEPHQLLITIDGVHVGQSVVGGGGHGMPAPQSFSGLFAGDASWETYALSADAALDVHFAATAGTHTVGVSFAEEFYEAEGVAQPPLTGLGWSYDESTTSPDGPAGPAVATLAVDGPFDASGPGTTSSRDRIFTCRPDTPDVAERCAIQILSTLAARAYRRPVAPADMQALMEFYRSGADRRGFEEGIRSAIERLLVDPNFLFRVERDGTTGGPAVARVADLALASRLSFFLWSSIPDDQLRERAAQGTLHEPAVLTAEVDRLRADARASSLVDNFAAQWLSLRRLGDITPDPELFTTFDGGLRQAFLEETTRFVASQIREDRSVLDLVAADYTYLNERLATHYDIPGVFGSHFRRVRVRDWSRGGLLGQGAILLLTSYPTRTSPVLRGRWLLDTLLAAPPPPPPADIPPLPPATIGGVPRSMKERTERHRANAVCASCHQRMDPLGFMLEQFDVVGRWRTIDEAGARVDASGRLPDGSEWTGVDGLRSLIEARPEEFAQAVTGRLLTYALGRALEPSDAPAVRKIVRDSAAVRYRWSALIHGVVESVPFQMRSVPR